MYIVVLGYDWCKYCKDAVKLLELNKIPYKYIDLKNDKTANKMVDISGMKTIPQIFFVDKQHVLKENLIGGFSDLELYINVVKFIKENQVDMKFLKFIEKNVEL